MEKLTPSEEQAMLTLWRIGQGTLGVVLDAMSEPKPHYNTLASTFKNLERKGYVRNKRYGSVYEYYPAVEREQMADRVVEDYFGDSYKSLVTHFAKEQKISADDLRDILSLIEKGKQP
ncbi:BlaI/MecI/CopY family transcriptional regulator [Siphonobacter aquaeclarae]|jgi:BlaI family penicillinase repressor|uniref:Predicted transcriptional regulator n=1 Tax=Siphonobacter aquaeclarae TaxID=563176 RepID=A0A1G9U8K6_9BACT|nr:BlaI/MecI/CopY family transcriptional regulator [Siphonobacter aquaeclarae]MBO9637242.1 BlaI/MecI/CopY family transcriptional regulator [Siphonobacter aquaeclarae]SDM56317.1 Predicted transcriptional regulator [Siphonobacter aquaeclarae]